MAHRLMRDPDADGWERSDFPIVCETCLGPNPYVRMQRIEFGGECHISGRPYTVFRWRPGNDARYKKTIVCQEVAKAKNVCQVCLLDLDYNLPVQVRDSALGLEDETLAVSDVGKEYQLNQMSKDGTLDSSFAKTTASDTIMKLQRTSPYYKRNKAPVCSFFVRGECKRGAECPYRHEMPTTGPLAEQNIKDRYYGVNDPVANKMMNRMDQMSKPEPPEDQSITTLYVGGLIPGSTDAELHDAFYRFGEITSIRVIELRRCAFVTFAERSQAEKAAEELCNKLLIRGQRVKVMWGKPQQRQDGGAVPPSMLPPQVAMQMGAGVPFAPPKAQSSTNYFNLPPNDLRPHTQRAYAAADPQQAGTHFPAPGEAQKRSTPAGPSEDAAAKRTRHEAPHSGMYPPPGGLRPPQMGVSAPVGPPGGYGGVGVPPPMYHQPRPPPVRPPAPVPAAAQ